MDSTASRRPCFVEVNDGLASIAEMEAGFSGNHHHHHHHHPVVSRSVCCSGKRRSFKNLLSCSPRSLRFYDARFEEPQPHFLHACFLCKKTLGDNRDIFMYRGDTPFCSDECRQEQIEIDEAKEKNWNLSSSMKALRKKEQRKSSSPSKARDYQFRTGTIAAA